MPESQCIKDPREAACPCFQKSSMITLLAIFQELYISVGRWCVSFINLKPRSLWKSFFFVWSNCSRTTPYVPPHLQFMSNDLKCRDRWQGNSMAFNIFMEKKKKPFPWERIESLLEMSNSCSIRSAALYTPQMVPACRPASLWWQ